MMLKVVELEGYTAKIPRHKSGKLAGGCIIYPCKWGKDERWGKDEGRTPPHFLLGIIFLPYNVLSILHARLVQKLEPSLKGQSWENKDS
jgi:hypothetical protein